MSDDHPTQKGSLSSETSTNRTSVNDDKQSATRMDLERDNNLTYNNLAYGREAPAIYNRVGNERKNLLGFTDQLEYGNEAPMMYADIGNADVSPISYSRLRYVKNKERAFNSSGCKEGRLCDGGGSITSNKLGIVGVVSSDSCEQVPKVQKLTGLIPNVDNIETLASAVQVDSRQGKPSFFLEKVCVQKDATVEITSNNIVDNAAPNSVSCEIFNQSSIGDIHKPKTMVVDCPTARVDVESNPNVCVDHNTILNIGTEDHPTHSVSTNIKMNEGALLVPYKSSSSSCAGIVLNVDMAVTQVEGGADSASSDIVSTDDMGITSKKCSELRSVNNLPRDLADVIIEKASTSRSNFIDARSVVLNGNVELEKSSEPDLSIKQNPRPVARVGPGTPPINLHVKNQNKSTEPMICPECIVNCVCDKKTPKDFSDSKQTRSQFSSVISAISEQVEKIISRQVAGEKLNKNFLAGDLAVLRECVPELYDISCSKPYFRYMIDESLRNRGFLVHASHAMIFEAKERRNAFHNGPKKTLSAYTDYVFVDDLEFVDTFHVQRQTLKPLFFCAKEYPRDALGTNEPIDKIMLLVLWYLSSEAPLTEAVKVFDLRSPQEVLQLLSTGFRVIEFMKARVKLVWPNSKEIEEIALNIHRLYDFPNVMGLMAHFILELENGRRTLVQAVCDHEYRFRDLYVSYDTRPEVAFQHSPLYRFIKKNKQLEGFHILSRNIVPSTNSCVLVPYEGDELDSGGHICYNALHLNTTELIAKSMENVLSRFPRLSALHGSVEKAAIIAACVLHNFCILERDLTPFQLTPSSAQSSKVTLDEVQKSHLNFVLTMA